MVADPLALPPNAKDIYLELTSQKSEGAIENDIFRINDVSFRIAPTDIHVSKESKNQRWQTLRTNYSRAIKSGYGSVYVSIHKVFKFSVARDAVEFVRMVAGLRATPFCIVQSEYLDRVIGRPDDEDPQRSTTGRRRSSTRPIMLALLSMTFSTMGHSGQPDVIEANMDFIYFNYLPYTNYIAYKSGNDYTQPGKPEESILWKKFYEPFLLKARIPDYPHREEDIRSRTTEFMWREFLYVPKGNPYALQAAKDLASAIKNQPKKFFDEVGQEIQVGEIRSGNELDVIYRAAIKRGLIKSSEISRLVSRLPEDIITNSTGNILVPIIRDILGERKRQRAGDTSYKAIKSSDSIELALETLNNKIKQLNEIGDLSSFTSNETGFTQLTGQDAEYQDKNGRNHIISDIMLMGRKRFYRVIHTNSQDYHNGPDNIIQQITISFQNNLAVIPVVGYKYPTIQHLGTSNIEVNFIMISKTSGVEGISRMYDSVETMAKKFKVVPAAYTNLYVKNDFLQLFGLTEFLTERLETSTLSDLPDRTMVNLTLTDAGITTSTKLQDPEELQQEFIQGDLGLYKGIWETLFKHTKQSNGINIHHLIAKIAIQQNTPENLRKWITKPTSYYYYYRKTSNLSIDSRNNAFMSLLLEAINNYNDFLKKVHQSIFLPTLSSGSNFDGATNYKALMELYESHPHYGFIPGITSIQNTVNKTIKAANESGYRMSFSQISDVQKYRKNIKDKINKMNQTRAGDTPEQTVLQASDFELDKYQQKMKNLFQRIIDDYLDTLPEFSHLIKAKKDAAIGVGSFAYQDFKQQITSVASFVSGDVSPTNLIKYDPDCYFYYPAFDGGSNSPLLGFVDEATLLAAKQHSREVYKNAYTDVNNYFKGTYHSRLKSDGYNLPYEVLIANKGEELVEPFYNKGRFTNSLANQNIKVNCVPDPGKVPTNWYPEDKPSIFGMYKIEHSTNIDDLWGGVDTQASDTPITPTQQSSKYFTSSTGGEQSLTPISSKGRKLTGRNRDRIRAILPFVQRAAANYGVPVALILAVIENESGFNPRAVGTSGEQGLMQLMVRFAARENGRVIKGRFVTSGWYTEAKKRHPNGLFDPATNIDIGTRYLGNLLKRYKEYALQAYNGGPGGAIAAKRVEKGTATNGQRKLAAKVNKYKAHVMQKYQKYLADKEFNTDAISAQRYTPPPTVQAKIDDTRTQKLGRDVSTTIQSPLGESIKEFERSLYLGQGQSMMRAYPAFKLYFIEDDKSEHRLAFDDFFSYSAVQSIEVFRSRKIAADICEIYLTNVSGVLSNRRFRHDLRGTQPRNAADKIINETPVGMRADTKDENPIASMLLQEGTHIQLRLGFTSDPSLMDTVFNGVITEIQFSETDEVIRLVAQSYAIELVQDLKGVQKHGKNSVETRTATKLFGWDFWGFADSATTGSILEDMMAQPEVNHFGRWTPTQGVMNPVRELLTQRWTWQPQPADDNIFAPDPEEEKTEISEGLVLKTISYTIYCTTIWDIFQEMTLRHPNYIALPVPYEDKYGPRMTMFYGLPNQLYFARHPTRNEEKADKKLQREMVETEKKVIEVETKEQRKKARVLKGYSSVGFDDYIVGQKEKNIHHAISTIYKNRRLEKAKIAGYIKPFRNYHLITSSQHIISNDINANAKDVANTIVIQYGKKAEIVDPRGGSVQSGVSIKDPSEFIIKLDNALPTEEIRTQIGQFINVTNEKLAKRYGLSLLCRNMREIYKGSITIIGNAKIKPTDVCFLMDEASGMIGAIEVREVYHRFDQNGGFRTEIVPDMLVQAAEWSLISSAEALSIVMEGIIRSQHSTKFNKDHAGFIRFDASLGGHLLDLFGGFLADKIINYTQLAQPIIMSPLMHNGRMFTGGVPVRKMPFSIWKSIFGKWSPVSDNNYDSWVDEVQDEMIGWIKKATGRYTQGTFFNNGGDSPE